MQALTGDNAVANPIRNTVISLEYMALSLTLYLTSRIE